MAGKLASRTCTPQNQGLWASRSTQRRAGRLQLGKRRWQSPDGAGGWKDRVIDGWLPLLRDLAMPGGLLEPMPDELAWASHLRASSALL